MLPTQMTCDIFQLKLVAVRTKSRKDVACRNVGNAQGRSLGCEEICWIATGEDESTVEKNVLPTQRENKAEPDARGCTAFSSLFSMSSVEACDDCYCDRNSFARI